MIYAIIKILGIMMYYQSRFAVKKILLTNFIKNVSSPRK